MPTFLHVDIAGTALVCNDWIVRMDVETSKCPIERSLRDTYREVLSSFELTDEQSCG